MNIRAESGGSLRFVGLLIQIDLTRIFMTKNGEFWSMMTKRLFELLVLCGALAELTWPSILNRRHIFREVFADFDPVAVSKLNEKKILAPGSTACSLLSELKLRAVIESARQVSKVCLAAAEGKQKDLNV